jgi:hypothetical protein
MKALDGAKRLKLVILDACRTNPFLASMTVKGGQKAIEKGLAPVEPRGSDTLVAFAAKAGGRKESQCPAMWRPIVVRSAPAPSVR